MTRRRRMSALRRWISTLLAGILVVCLVASSAVVAVVARPGTALPAASVETVAGAGVPDSVLVSRALFGSSENAVVVAADSDQADSADASDLASANRVPMFRVSSATVDAVSDELGRLGVQRAIRVGGDVPDLGVPVTDDAGPLVGGAPNGTGVIVLLSGAGDDAVATANASGARAVSMPAPDPRSSGEAVRLLTEDPDAPVRAIGADFGDSDLLRRRIQLARTVPELPGGGQLMFPGRRVVALYGSPGAPELGPLGRQSIPESIARAKALAARYDRISPVPVVPGFEIIVSVASAEPGPGGDYSSVLDVIAAGSTRGARSWRS